MMERVDWKNFKSDEDIVSYLSKLPRYRNTPIKSILSRLRFFLSVLYCRLFGIDKPLFVVLVTNNTCNLNCIYCYGEYGKRTKKDDYSTGVLLEIIDELKELGTTLLTIHGGESLLRKDIGEILNYVKLKGFYVSFNTNGYFVPHKIKDLLGVDTVVLSLDGREENNDKNRGKGCYQKVMKAIDILHQHNLPVVVSATINKHTLNDMEYLAELAVEKKFRIQYSILYNGDKLKTQEYSGVMTDEENRSVAKKILALKKKGYPVYYSGDILETAIYWPFSFDEKQVITRADVQAGLQQKKMRLIPCYHGRLKYQIDADGRVVLCWAQNDADAPNVKKVGVAKAIQTCHDNKKCEYCVFLANNEHNAVLNLGLKNIWDIAAIQFADALEIRKKKVKSNQ